MSQIDSQDPSSEVPDLVFETPAVTEQKPQEVEAEKSPQEEEKVGAAVSVPNAMIEHPILLVGKEEDEDSISLPSNLDSRAAKSMERADQVDLLGSEHAHAWANTVQEGVVFNTIDEVLVDALADPEKEFSNSVKHNGREFVSATPTQRPLPGQAVSGEPAVLRMMSRLSLGVPRQMALWHTGIWITFKPPVETSILDLARAISADKITFGRESYALMYSNLSTVTMQRVVDFALKHVLSLTVGNDEIPLDKLPQYISCLDIPTLITGFAQTMYPRGFKYKRACVNSPGKCSHVEHGTLNVFKMQNTSTKTLTEWQKNHMSSRQAKLKKLADITRYQEELQGSQKRRVVLREGEVDEVAFVLRIPSVAEYIDAGYNWINGIVTNVERVMEDDPSIVNRNAEIMRYGRATAMQQYVHWVESMEEKIQAANGDLITETISDRSTIARNLDVMSADDVIREFFMGEVVKFINHATIDVIGIPVYECSVCGDKQQSEEEVKFPQHKEIIPLDVLQLFFALISRKVDRINQR